MEHIRTITREFATGAKAVLHLEARSGSVIVEGRETDRVTVEAVVHSWTDLSAEADDAAALVERNMEQDGHRVIVRTPSLQQREGWTALLGRQGTRVDYHVRVPQRTAVRVLSRSGSVQISRVEGVVHSEAMSGKVGVDDVRGNVTLVSRSGGLTAEKIIGDVTIDARSGKVRVRDVAGGVQAEARSGSVEIASVTGDVRLSASSGTVAVEEVCGKLHIRSRAGSLRYRGAVRDDIDIEANAGSITLAVDPAYPFFIDAESRVGSVTSDLPPRRPGAGPSGEGPKVKLRTRAGSIRVTKA